MKRLLLCVALVACKDKDAQPAAKPASGDVAQPAQQPTSRAQKSIVVPKARRPDAPPAKLVIEPTKINIVSASEKELAIDASGKVIAAGKEVGKITADGKLTKADGTVIASLDEDGTVNFAGDTGNDRVIQIDPDGGVQVDGQEVLRIDEKGGVQKRNAKGVLEDDGLAVFEGPPSTRRGIALLLVAMMMSARPSAAPPPSSSGPVPTPR